MLHDTDSQEEGQAPKLRRVAEFQERISVQLTEEDFRRLADVAEQLDRSMAYLGRLAIREWLDRQEEQAEGQQ